MQRLHFNLNSHNLNESVNLAMSRNTKFSTICNATIISVRFIGFYHFFLRNFIVNYKHYILVVSHHKKDQDNHMRTM